MLKKDVRVGDTYTCKVSGKLTTVRITAKRVKGWDALNTATNRPVRIPTAARLRGEANPPVREKVTTAKASQPRGDMPKRVVVDGPYTEEPPDLDAAIDDAVDILGEMREAVKDLPGQDDFMYRLDRCIQVLTDHIAY